MHVAFNVDCHVMLNWLVNLEKFKPPMHELFCFMLVLALTTSRLDGPQKEPPHRKEPLNERSRPIERSPPLKGAHPTEEAQQTKGAIQTRGAHPTKEAVKRKEPKK